MTENNRPVHSIRYGNVEASVWARNSPAGYFFDTTFGRVFKSGDEWGKSTTFDDRDLPALAKAAADVHTWIQQAKQNAVTTLGTSETDARRQRSCLKLEKTPLLTGPPQAAGRILYPSRMWVTTGLVKRDAADGLSTKGPTARVATSATVQAVGLACRSEAVKRCGSLPPRRTWACAT